MIPNNLASVLAGRKRFIDTFSEESVGTSASSESVLPDGNNSKFNKFKFVEKSSTGYTGIVNQGATCYLNSLLQIISLLISKSCKYCFMDTRDG